MIYVSICYYVEFYVKFFDVRGPSCGSLIKPCLQPGTGLWFGAEYNKSTRRNFDNLQNHII